MHPIPFSRPHDTGKEIHYIAEAIASRHLSGDGAFTKKCNSLLETRYGTPKALLTHSCTAALEMAAILTDIAPGDEVIMPSYTFVSTANAFALRGAKIRFCDIRPDTLNIDETKIEALVTKHTKVIVPVHYAGVACKMDAIMDIARRHNLFVVEDAAQGVDSTYKGRSLGTIGHLGCYSFHETKNIVSGEGGALLINDERFMDRAEIIREKGTNRSQFFRGQVDKYTWVDIGSSYLPAEIVAAFLLAQLEAAPSIQARRRNIFDRYHAAFEPLEAAGKIRRPTIPQECAHNGHMYYFICASLGERTQLIAHLKAAAISPTFHYVPLHTSPMGQRIDKEAVSLPVTEDLADRLVRMPLFFDLTDDDQNRVINHVLEFYGQ